MVVRFLDACKAAYACALWNGPSIYVYVRADHCLNLQLSFRPTIGELKERKIIKFNDYVEVSFFKTDMNNSNKNFILVIILFIVYY